MVKTAFIFPGQGAQYPGMGWDLYIAYPEARDVFERAAAVLGRHLLKVIFRGPEEELQKTEYTQPALLTVSTAVHAVLRSRWRCPDGVAGLSLGEYTALVAAGSLSFEEALVLVQKRACFMQGTIPAGVGTMAAVIGLSREETVRVCREVSGGGVVAPANFNCPGQVVISGEAETVRRAGGLAVQAGARKVIPLKVSAPFHTSLLAPVEELLARELRAVTVGKPEVPVVFNVSAGFLEDPIKIREALVKQITHPVLWEDSIGAMVREGYEYFLELGPGRVLTGFMKRIAPWVRAVAVGNQSSLEKVLMEP